MLERIWDKIKDGIWLPQAFDIATKEASFRLWCAWMSFHLAWISVVVLHFKPVETASWTAIGFYGLTMVFYMLKKLSKAKIDLDDKSLELEDNSEEEKKDKNSTAAVDN